MSAPTSQPIWKIWLDRLLVVNVFLVMGGAAWFGLAVVSSSQGLEAPMRQFMRLWEPLFTPAIGLLMGAALINGVWSWWQRQVQRARSDSES